MEEDERNKKLKAGKEKLAQFQKKRKKNKHVDSKDKKQEIRDSRSLESTSESTSAADLFSYDSDSLSIGSISEEDSSADNSARESLSKSLLSVKTQLRETTDRVDELEESLIGKQLALDSVIKENEAMRQKISQETEDNSHDGEQGSQTEAGECSSLPVTQTENQSDDSNTSANQSTKSPDPVDENAALDISDLTQQVQWLQLQLKQTGSTVHMQTERQTETVNALKQAKKEVLSLQDNACQKDQLVEQLADKLVQISSQYGDLKDAYGKIQSSSSNMDIEKASNYEEDVGKRLLEVRETMQQEHEKQIEKINVEKDAELKFARQECQMMKEMHQRVNSDVDDLTNEVQVLKTEIERVKFENDSLSEQLAHTQEENKRFQEDSEESKIKLDAMEKELTSVRESRENVDQENLALKDELCSIKEEKDRLNSELQLSKTEKDCVLSELENMKEEASSAESIKQDLEIKLTTLQEEWQARKSSYDTFLTEKLSIEDELKTLNEDYQTSLEQITAYEAQIVEYESRISQCSDLVEENQNLRTQNDELYNKINNQKDDIAKLCSDLELINGESAQLADTLKEMSTVMTTYKQEAEVFELHKEKMKDIIDGLNMSLQEEKESSSQKEQQLQAELEQLRKELADSNQESEDYKTQFDFLKSSSVNTINNAENSNTDSESLGQVKTALECMIEPETILPEIQQHYLTAPTLSESFLEEQESASHNVNVDDGLHNDPADVKESVKKDIVDGLSSSLDEKSDNQEAAVVEMEEPCSSHSQSPIDRDNTISELQSEVERLRGELAVALSKSISEPGLQKQNTKTKTEDNQTLDGACDTSEGSTALSTKGMEEELLELREKLATMKESYSSVVSGVDVLLAEKDSVVSERDSLQAQFVHVQEELDQTKAVVNGLKSEIQRLQQTTLEVNTREVSDLDLPSIVASGSEEFLHASSNFNRFHGDANVDPSSLTVFSVEGNDFQPQPSSLEPEQLVSVDTSVQQKEEIASTQTGDLQGLPSPSSKSTEVKDVYKSEQSTDASVSTSGESTVPDESKETLNKSMSAERDQLASEVSFERISALELKEQVETMSKVKETLEKELELKTADIEVLHDEKSNQQSRCEELEHEKDQLERQIAKKNDIQETMSSELKQSSAQHSELKTVIETLQKDNERLNSEMTVKLSEMDAKKLLMNGKETEFAELKTKSETLESEYELLLSDCKTLLTGRDKAEEHFSDAVQEHESEIASLKQQINKLENQNELLAKKNEVVAEVITSADSEKQEMLLKIEELGRSTEVLTEQLKLLQGERNSLRKDKDRLENEVQGLKQDLGELIQQTETIDEKYGEKSDENEKLKNEVKVLQNQIEDFQTKISGMEEELLELCNQLQSYDDTLVQKEDLATRLEREVVEVLEENSALKDKVKDLGYEIDGYNEKCRIMSEQLEMYSSDLQSSSSEKDKSVSDQLELELKMKQKLQRDLEKQQEEAVEARKDISDLTYHLEMVCKETSGYEEDISQKGKMIEKLSQERDSLALEKSHLGQELKRLEQDFTTVLQQREHMAGEVDTLQQHLNAVSDNRNHVRTQIEILASELESVSISRDELAGRYYSIEKENMSLRQTDQEKTSLLETMQEKVDNFQEILEEKLNLEDENSVLIGQIEELDSRVCNVQEEKEDVEKVVDDLTTMLRDMQTKYEEVRSEMEATKKKCDKEIYLLQTNLSTMNTSVQELRSMLDFMEKEMSEASEEKTCLKENLEQQQNQYLETVEQKQKLEELLGEKHQKDLKNQKTVSDRNRTDQSQSRNEPSSSTSSSSYTQGTGRQDAGASALPQMVNRETQTEEEQVFYSSQRDPETGNIRTFLKSFSDAGVQTDFSPTATTTTTNEHSSSNDSVLDEVDNSTTDGDSAIYRSGEDSDTTMAEGPLRTAYKDAESQNTNAVKLSEEDFTAAVPYTSDTGDSGVYDLQLAELRARLTQSRVDLETLKQLYEEQIADLKKVNEISSSLSVDNETQTSMSDGTQSIDGGLEDMRDTLEQEFEQKEKDLEQQIEERLLKKFEFRENKLKMQEDNYQKRIESAEYDIEDKCMAKFRDREVEIVVAAEQDIKKHSQALECSTEKKIKKFEKKKEAEFVATMKAVREDLASKHQQELEQLQAENQSKGITVYRDEDDGEPDLERMVDRLNKEKQDLLKSKEALRGQIEAIHQQHDLLRNSFEGIMSDKPGQSTQREASSDTSVDQEDQAGWLDWKLAPDFSFGSQFGADSLSESFDQGQICAKEGCQSTKLRYQDLVERIRRFRSLSKTVHEISSPRGLDIPEDGSSSDEDTKEDEPTGMFVEDPDGELCALQRITTIHLEHSVREKAMSPNGNASEFIAETSDVSDVNVEGHFQASHVAMTENALGHFSENEDDESSDEGEEVVSFREQKQKLFSKDKGGSSHFHADSAEGHFSGNESTDEDSIQEDIAEQRPHSDSDEGNDSIFFKVNKEFQFPEQGEHGDGSSVDELRGGRFSHGSADSAERRFSQRRCFSDSGVCVDHSEFNAEGEFVKYDTIHTTTLPRRDEGSPSEGQFVREKNKFSSEITDEADQTADTNPLTADGETNLLFPNLSAIPLESTEPMTGPQDLSLGTLQSTSQFVMEMSPKDEQPPGSEEFGHMGLTLVRSPGNTGEETGDYFEEKTVPAMAEMPLSHERSSSNLRTPSISAVALTSAVGVLEDEFLCDYSMPVCRSLVRQEGVSAGDSFTDEQIDSGDILETLQLEIQRDKIAQANRKEKSRAPDRFLAEGDALEPVELAGRVQGQDQQSQIEPIESPQSFENAVFDLINSSSSVVQSVMPNIMASSSVRDDPGLEYREAASSETDAVVDNMENTCVDFSESAVETDIVELRLKCEELQKHVSALTEENHVFQEQLAEHRNVCDKNEQLCEENRLLMSATDELKVKCESVEEMENVVLSLDEQVRRLTTDRADLEQRLQGIVESNHKVEVEKARLDVQIQSMRSEMEMLKNPSLTTPHMDSFDFNELKVDVEALQMEKDALQKSLEEIQVEKQQFEICVCDLETQLEIAHRDREQIMLRMTSDKHKWEAEIETLHSKLETDEQSIDTVDSSLDDQVKKLRKDNEELQNKLAIMEETFRSLLKEAQDEKDSTDKQLSLEIQTLKEEREETGREMDNCIQSLQTQIQEIKEEKAHLSQFHQTETNVLVKENDELYEKISNTEETFKSILKETQDERDALSEMFKLEIELLKKNVKEKQEAMDCCKESWQCERQKLKEEVAQMEQSHHAEVELLVKERDELLMKIDNLEETVLQETQTEVDASKGMVELEIESLKTDKAKLQKEMDTCVDSFQSEIQKLAEDRTLLKQSHSLELDSWRHENSELRKKIEGMEEMLKFGVEKPAELQKENSEEIEKEMESCLKSLQTEIQELKTNMAMLEQSHLSELESLQQENAELQKMLNIEEETCESILEESQHDKDSNTEMFKLEIESLKEERNKIQEEMDKRKDSLQSQVLELKEEKGILEQSCQAELDSLKTENAELQKKMDIMDETFKSLLKESDDEKHAKYEMFQLEIELLKKDRNKSQTEMEKCKDICEQRIQESKEEKALLEQSNQVELTSLRQERDELLTKVDVMDDTFNDLLNEEQIKKDAESEVLISKINSLKKQRDETEKEMDSCIGVLQSQIKQTTEDKTRVEQSYVLELDLLKKERDAALEKVNLLERATDSQEQKKVEKVLESQKDESQKNLEVLQQSPVSEIDCHKKENGSMAEKIVSLEQALQTQIQEADKLKALLEQSSTEEISEDSEKEMESCLKSLQSEIQELKTNMAMLEKSHRSELESLQQENAELQKMLNIEEETCESILEESQHDKDSNTEMFKLEIESLKEERNTIQEEMDKYRQMLEQSSNQELDRIKSENDILEEALRTMEEAFHSKLKAIEKEKSELVESNIQLKQSLDEVKKDANNATDGNSYLRLKNKILKLENEKQDLLKQLDDQMKERNSVSDQVDSLTVDLCTEIKVLEAEKKMMKDKLAEELKTHNHEKEEILKMYKDLKSQLEPMVVAKQELEDEVKELREAVEDRSAIVKHDRKQLSMVRKADVRHREDGAIPEDGTTPEEEDVRFTPVLTVEDLEELEELKNNLKALKRDMKEKDMYVRTLEEHLLNLGSLPVPQRTPMARHGGRFGGPGRDTEDTKAGGTDLLESSRNRSRLVDSWNDSTDSQGVGVSGATGGRMELQDLSSITLDSNDSTLSDGQDDEALHGQELESRLFTSSVQSSYANNRSLNFTLDSFDGSERIRSGLTAGEDGHVALELKQFELVDEISNLRRDFYETKAIYAQETALLTEALEREKIMSQSTINQSGSVTKSMNLSSSLLDADTSLTLESNRLRQEVAVLKEENKLLKIENDRWMKRLKEQEAVVLELKERLSRNTVGIEEIEEVFGRQLALLQKQREELVDKLRDRERQNERLSSSLGEKSLIEETLRREKDILVVKLQEKSEVEKELQEKRLAVEKMTNEQILLEERIYQKDLSERELMKQKRLLEQDLFEIEAKLRDREEFLGYEKNQLLQELRDKRVNVRRRSWLSEADDDTRSIGSDSSGISDRHIGRLEIMLEEVEKQHAAAVKVLREQLKSKYERRESALQDSHTGSLSVLKRKQQSQVQET